MSSSHRSAGQHAPARQQPNPSKSTQRCSCAQHLLYTAIHACKAAPSDKSDCCSSSCKVSRSLRPPDCGRLTAAGLATAGPFPTGAGRPDTSKTDAKAVGCRAAPAWLPARSSGPDCPPSKRLRTLEAIDSSMLAILRPLWKNGSGAASCRATGSSADE